MGGEGTVILAVQLLMVGRYLCYSIITVYYTIVDQVGRRCTQ